MGIEQEISARMVHSSLEDGEIKTSVYFSPLLGDDEFYELVRQCWEEESYGIDGVAVMFDIETAASDLVDGYTTNGGAVDISDKPIFDAMKRKLEAALKTINAVKYE